MGDVGIRVRPFGKFSDAEDMKLLRLRAEGKIFSEIAEDLDRSLSGVKDRYKAIMEGREHRPNGCRGRNYANLKPIFDPQPVADDAPHVAALNRLGGFCRANQWSLPPLTRS